MPYLTAATKSLIHKETLRLNLHTWKLHPWTRCGKRGGYISLSAILGSRQEVLITRIPAPTLGIGEAVYMELNQWLAKRPDWNGITESTQDHVPIESGDIDWSKL